MTLYFLIIVLTFWGRSECHWMNVNKSEFCSNVLTCSTTAANANAIPQADDRSYENVTNSVCEFATLCSNSNGVISGTPNTARNEEDNLYPINTNKTEFCSILNACDNNGDIHSYMYPFHYVQNMTEYCPYTEYCGLNATKPLPKASSVPCCLPCSCSPDCGLRHDCCFPSLDRYHVIEKENLSCVNLPIPAGGFGLYMYDKCPNGTECFIPTSTDRTPSPVSSSVTHRIYINRECAQCNGDLSKSDFTDWSLQIPSGKKLDLRACFSGALHCYFNVLIPPTHWQWIMHFGCMRNFVDSCSKDYTNQPVIDACANVHAPVVIKRTIFNSVHCLACSTSTSLSQASAICNDLGTGVSRWSFSVVLDMRIIHDSKQHTPSCDERHADLREKIDCRDVLCPEWMSRVNGVCRHFIKYWNNPKLTFQFVLRPHVRIKTKLFQNMTKSDRYYIDKWLSTECGLKLQSQTNTASVFSKLYMLPIKVQNTMIIKEFLLRLSYNPHSIVRPSQFIQAIDRCMKGRWKMLLDGNHYSLSVSHYRYSVFMPDGKKQRRHVSLNTSLSESPLPKIHEPITIRYFDRPEYERYVLRFSSESVPVTKLVFCERFEITSDEVELHFGEIRIKSSGKLLGDNEFEIQYKTVNKQIVVAAIYVCLEDYLPEPTNVAHYIGITSVWTTLSLIRLVWILIWPC